MTDWPSNAPEPHTVTYMTWRMVGDEIFPLVGDEPVTEDECATRFAQVYGRPPEFIVGPYYRHLWVGPIDADALS